MDEIDSNALAAGDTDLRARLDHCSRLSRKTFSISSCKATNSVYTSLHGISDEAAELLKSLWSSIV